MFWEPIGHDWKRGFTGTLHLPTADANYSHLVEIDIVATEAGGKTIPVTPLYATFSGSTITFTTDTFPVVFPFTTEVWTLKFRCINDANKATASPTFRTVTVTAPVVSSATASETGPRLQQPLQSGLPGGALTTSVTVTPVLSFNPGGGSAKQNITIYETHDWGDGRGAVTTWKGWHDVIGTTSAVVLTGDNLLFVTTLASTTVTIKVAIGAVDKEKPIPAVVATTSFTMNGPSTLAANTITAASVLGIKYSRKPGGYQWAWTGFQCTCPLVTSGPVTFNANLFYGRFYLAKGAWNVGTQTWTTDPNYEEWAVGDTEDETVTISTNLVTTVASPPQEFPSPSDPFPTFRIRLSAFTRRTGDTGVAQNSWTGGEPAGAVNATSGLAVYITPDVTKASFLANDIDLNTIGDRLNVTGGKLNVTTPLAPAPVSVTAVVFATSFGIGDPHYLAPVALGLPYWNAVLTITLNTANVNYPHTKQLNIQIPGYSDFTATSWTLVGSVATITIPSQIQDTASHGLTISVFALNEDSAPSATAATASITVPAATSPISGSAPLAPSFAGVTATAPPYFLRNGRDFSVGFIPDFIAPANPGGGTYDVQVSKLYPSGARGFISTMPGPFTPSVHYSFTTEAPDVLIVGNWVVEFAPINADGLFSAVRQVTVPVAANVISSISAVEGSPFYEGGGGNQVRLSVTPTFTTVNAPGLSTAAPQAISIYLSADSGTTWFGLGWFDITASGAVQSIPVWRPTDATKTCKVAAVIGGYNQPPDTFNGVSTTGPLATAALPAGTVISGSTFTIAVIGAPIATGVSNAFVKTRTAVSPYAYNGVTIGKTKDGVVYWGLPDGIQWTNPTAAADPNFWYSMLEIYMVNVSDVAAPSNAGGVLRGLKDDALNAIPGATTSVAFDKFEFQEVAQEAFVYVHLQIACFSRSGQRTLQTICWSGTNHTNVFFGPAPASSIVAALDPSWAGTAISITGGKINTRVPGAAVQKLVNPAFDNWPTGWTTSGTWTLRPFNFRSATPGISSTQANAAASQSFSAAAGNSYTFSAWLEGASANAGAWVQLSFFPSGQLFVGNVAASNFTYIQSVVTAVAPAGTTNVTAQIQLGPISVGEWYVDDASLLESTGGGAGVAVNGANDLILNANAEFKFVGGQLQINGVDFTKGFNGFAVGSAAVPQITISPGGVPMGWIGSDATSGFTGAWFKRVMIGGTSPANAPFFADANGNVSISGLLIVGTLFSVNMNGGTLSLTLNGISTLINNVNDFSAGQFVGCRVQDNSTFAYSAQHAYGYWANFNNGTAHLQVVAGAYGRLNLTSSFGTSIAINGNGQVSINGAFAQTITLSFIKPGGATGTATYSSGWLTSST